MEVPVDEFGIHQWCQKQGLAGDLGGESERLPERYLEGIYHLARQYEVSVAQGAAVQEGDLATVFE